MDRKNLLIENLESSLTESRDYVSEVIPLLGKYQDQLTVEQLSSESGNSWETQRKQLEE